MVYFSKIIEDINENLFRFKITCSCSQIENIFGPFVQIGEQEIDWKSIDGIKSLVEKIVEFQGRKKIIVTPNKWIYVRKEN